MRRFLALYIILLALTTGLFAQSGFKKQYSESVSRYDTSQPTENNDKKDDDEVVRVETDLVTIPVRVTTKGGRPVPDIKHSEFKIFEDGVEQDVAFFGTNDAPFTVALLLDMSYSAIFKLPEIQAAAKQFVAQLKPNDKVMIISFDEKVRVLCEATDNRKALRYAIEGSRVGSGTSVYDAVDTVINNKFQKLPGRKAIVLLSDGVDTTSKRTNLKSILGDVNETDLLIYPIQYDTFDDVQNNRRKDAEIRYDDNDRPYVVDTPRGKGERDEDYADAREFLTEMAERTGGRVQRVNTSTNLAAAFARIADELRKTYSLGYYPTSERKPGGKYLRVRVYRPDLAVRARETYLKPVVK